MTDKIPKIISVLLKLRKRGYRKSTIENIDKTLRQIAKHCSLDNPDCVLKYVADRECSEARKEILCNAYSHYCKVHDVPFEKPRYEKTDKVPFIPLESDIDSLISAVPFRTSIFLQTLKETGARSGELWKLNVNDVDFNRDIIYINNPEKRSNSRAIKVSKKLINMIQELYARTRNNKVFQWESDNLRSFTRIFERQRKRASLKLQNPKIIQISFKTLRHWKGTIEYCKTRDILHVKGILGHKAISNTLKYIHLAELLYDNSEDYTCKTAKTIKEATNLIEAGFEYVTEMDGMKLFRKRK